MSVNAVRLPVIGAAKKSSSQTGRAPAANARTSDVTAAETPCDQAQSALSECVTRTVRRYLVDIGDTECAEGLQALVLREVETPLLREVLAFHEGNQSRAAAALGINRATLRKKLTTYGLL